MNQKEWTIMIYMAGDNNLAVDMAYALEQIKGVAGDGPDSPNLFVYYDGNSPAIPTLYCDFSDPRDPKYVRSFRVPDKRHPVPKKQNENAADWRSILNFVDWCVNKVEVQSNGEVTYGRRANRYALIFSGHSLGFQDIGLFRDESSGKSMKMNDLYGALEILVTPEADLKKFAEGLEGDDFRRETRMLLGQKLDLLGFDSCVMGMLEVGYQFSYVAKTMIASEGSVPSAGWTYAKILGDLACRDGAEVVAERFVRKFIESQDSFTVGGVSVDMAAWDMTRINDLAKAFDELSWALLDCFYDPESVVHRQMERVVLQAHYKCQSYMYDQNIDLGDFCELLERECASVIEEFGGDETGLLENVRAACVKVLDELKRVVILSGFSGGGYQYSNGISVFFPWSREGYEVSQKNYESLFFVKDVGREKKFMWPGFLKKYLNEVTLRKSAPPTENAAAGARYRYTSGISFNEDSFTNAREIDNGKLAGERDSKLAGERDSKLAGERDSKLAGERDSKLAGERDSKLAGERDSKLAGERDSKLAGERDSKLAGERDSKLAGERDSKLAGERDSKLAGERNSKMAGGGSNTFFDNLRLFKNIESRWDISGFTKKKSDSVQESEAASG